MEDHSYKAEADDLFEKEDANEDGFIKFDEFIANSGEGKEGGVRIGEKWCFVGSMHYRAVVMVVCNSKGRN